MHLLADLRARSPISVRVDAQPYSSLNPNSDVILRIDFRYIGCDSNFLIFLADGGPWLPPPLYKFKALGETTTFSLPTYDHLCYHFNSKAYTVRLEGGDWSDPLDWIEIAADKSSLTVTPSLQQFEEYAGQVLQIFFVVSDTATYKPMESNEEVYFDVQIPTQAELYCKDSTIEFTQDQLSYVFTLPPNGKPNIEVFLMPEAPDTASKEILGDPTGLVACGDRTYEVLSN